MRNAGGKVGGSRQLPNRNFTVKMGQRIDAEWLAKNPPKKGEPLLSTSIFQATEYATGEQKEQFLAKLKAFAESGFDRRKWTKPMYHHLVSLFGHNAHSNIEGFWERWFSNPCMQAQWVQHVIAYPCYGDAGTTWSDMEQAFIDWLKSDDAGIEVCTTAAIECIKVVEAGERTSLEELVHKHPKWTREILRSL